MDCSVRVFPFETVSFTIRLAVSLHGSELARGEQRVHCEIVMELLANRVVRLMRLVTVFTIILLVIVPFALWSRIPIPPYAIDLTDLAGQATTVFRGTVLDVSARPEPSIYPRAIARFQVDRSYRNQRGSIATVYVEPYSHDLALNGHSCIDFTPDSRWLVFAAEKHGHLELVHDCDGAVTVSRLLAPILDGAELLSHLEADFTAGLDDPDQASRVISIQRLGGLRLLSSRPALHRIIERRTPADVDWAAYAALRTGDSTVLPNVLDVFTRGVSAPHPADVAWEISRLTDKSATAGLIEIANIAPQPVARVYAISALTEKIRAPESLPTVAFHLTDPDRSVRYHALNGMRLLTQEPACTLPTEPRWTEDMIEPQIQQCLVWWERVGKRRFSHNQ